jgi:signal transduction histidine kinase
MAHDRGDFAANDLSDRAADWLDLAQDAGRIGLFEWTIASASVRASPQWLTLYELSAFDGRHETWLQSIFREDRIRVADEFERAFAARASSLDMEFRVGGAERGLVWIEARNRIVYDAHGVPERVVAAHVDITERKRMLTQLHAFRETLEGRVAEQQRIATELSEQRHILGTLNRTAAALAVELDLEKLVQSVTDAGTDLIGAQFGAFFYNVINENGASLTLYTISGVPREHFSKFPMPRATKVFEPTFLGLGVVRSNDILKDPRYGLSAPHYGMPPGHLAVRSYLAAPVRSRSGDVLGGLFFGHAEVDQFSAADEAIITGLAAQAAIGIDNARLFQAAERELAERRRAEATIKQNEARLAFLDALGRATAAALDAESVLATTTRMLGEYLGVDLCAYADVEPDQDTVTIRDDWSAEGVSSLVGTYKLSAFGASVMQKVRAGQALILNDVIAELDPEQAASFLQLGVRATVCMPFVRRGVLTALMAINSAQPHTWTEDEVALLGDVTERSWAHIERVRSSAALRELNATLEQRVALEVAERARAEEQLRQAQKMEAVGQLTGGIAHDFNNLLAGITGSFSLIERRLADGKPGVERYIAAGQDAAKRAAALTHRLLAFSRRQTLDPRPIDANKLVAGMGDLIRRTMGPGIDVEIVGAGGLWATKVDPSQLENSLLNLCINARDAIGPGGGRVTIETANKWLDHRAAKECDLPPGQYISLCVTDTGAGMAPDIVARAFDPFFTTKPLGQGTGLGLSMIYGFVRQSGGQVRIYSEPGQGTTMRLYLPRYRGEVPEAEEQAGADAIDRGAGETVLIIDDEPTLRMLLSDVLEDAGYRVLTAADGPSGLKFIQSDMRIDLLITDVGLPGGMNGRQVADAARTQRPNLRVLFITGYAENAAIGNGHLEPGMEILTKPFEISILGSKVREMLETAP